MYKYRSTDKLFSKLTPEVKELTKKMVIANLDEMEELQKESVGYNSEFTRIMNVMSKSFELSKEDMTTIYMKCLNNGASKEDILYKLNEYIPREEREEFEERINKANIHPNPKYFWLKDKGLKRIYIENGENRNTIKSKIQADGKCFSTKIKTDMTGESKEGKKIVVNNLSKWLFGVPGARGKLTITRSGNCIQLPKNTPDETVKLIEDVIYEKEIEEPEK